MQLIVLHVCCLFLDLPGSSRYSSPAFCLVCQQMGAPLNRYITQHSQTTSLTKHQLILLIHKMWGKCQHNQQRHIITWKFAVLKKVPTGLRLALLLASQSLTRGWATLRLIPDPGSFTSSSLISPDSRPSSSSLIPVRRTQLPAQVSAARGPSSATQLLSEAGHVVGFSTQRAEKLKWPAFHPFCLPVDSSSPVNLSSVAT